MKINRITDRDGIYKGIKLWNRENPDLKIIDRLIEQNIFAPYAGVNVVGWSCIEGDDYLAFGLSKHLSKPITGYADTDRGWISLLVIDSLKNTAEIAGQRLLKEIEDFLSNRGVKKISFGGDPQNYLPGLPVEMEVSYQALLEERNFRDYGRVYDLYSDILNFEEPSRVKQIKIEYGDILKAKPVTLEDERDLLDFLAQNFPGRWSYEAENIKRIPGGINDYWLLWYQKKPVGFVRINRFDSSYLGPNVNWGRQWGEKYCGLGPLGIDKNYQKRGWGLYLMVMVIKSLQEKGYQHMIIDWTTLVDYYKKLGFNTCREYVMFNCELF